MGKCCCLVQNKRGLNPLDKDGNKNPILGQKWYAYFWKHNFQKINQTGQFITTSSRCLTKFMIHWKKAGGAEKLSEPVWVNYKWLKPEKENAFEQQTTHLLMHPEYVIVDEAGCNTSQEGDGARGGEKKNVFRLTSVAKKAATAINTHFTSLGLNAATSEPVMCANIVSEKNMKPEVITSLDVFAEKNGDENDQDFIPWNTGPGKIYLNGPSCFFKGKEVS
jgi:hypothetical protein